MEAKRLSALSLPLLQGLCRAQGCSTTGSKTDLVERLVAKGQNASKKNGKIGATKRAAREDTAPQKPPPCDLPHAELEKPSASQVTMSALAPPRDPELHLAQAKRSRVEPRADVNHSAEILAMTLRPAAVKTEVAVRAPARDASEFNILRCARCAKIFDLKRARYTRAFRSFVCPPCRFRIMDPFNEVPSNDDSLVHCSLVSASPLNFKLDLSRLEAWRAAGDAVEVRMLRVDDDRIEQVWPDEVVFEANGRELFRVKPPEAGHTRRDVPEIITAGLQRGANAISIRMTHSGPLLGFALAIVHSTPRRSRELCARVTRCEREDALARVRALLTRDPSLGLADGVECLSSNRLQLTCPITLDRVHVPARGRTCLHLRCFDLAAYCRSSRGMSAFNKRWSCPVCGDQLRPEDLCIDAYVERVLAETDGFVEPVEAVAVSLDGSWVQLPDSAVSAASENA
eukprot:TRINITY_DN25742_c0_g6_i1.p1 TRINITY_DN25742_c0_g6~~TRINITY_DN25742_c0_g6_i1.p1  ORF type:complete len:457 (-),score=57.16 TRINITY_DN25742_c0_g6_i1:20-1390(-)